MSEIEKHGIPRHHLQLGLEDEDKEMRAKCFLILCLSLDYKQTYLSVSHLHSRVDTRVRGVC